MGFMTGHKTSLVYRGVKMDSDEEVFVAMWLQELQEAGYIKKWDKVNDAIPLTSGLKLPYVQEVKLKTKVKTTNKVLTVLRPSEYTPDFEVLWTIDGWGTFVSPITNQPSTRELVNPSKPFVGKYHLVEPMLMEVKPSFDQNNMERLFKLNQKFLWDKEKIFVNLVEPIALFKKTFIPLAAYQYFKYKVVPKKAQAKGKVKGSWKFDFVPKTLPEYLNSLK